MSGKELEPRKGGELVEEMEDLVSGLLDKAEERGHRGRSTGAGIGGGLGAIVGSFAGPLGAAVGGLVGAGIGALLGEEFDD